MISLAQLHHQLGNDLRPAGGGTVARRQISGVHISELADPTPYLEGGELLLTTGIPVLGGETKVRAYVRRLTGKGIAALGLGLGAGIDQLPPSLLEACKEAGLELLLIPDGVPFMNVSRAYWDLVAREGQADLASSLGTQTALAQAATRPDALQSVVRALAQALGGWVAYLPADNGAQTLWPESSRGVMAQLCQETRRVNTAGTHSAATFTIHGTDVVEYPVLVGRKTAGFLAIGAGRKLTRADRQIILTVCVLLSLKAQQQQESDSTAAALGSAVAKLFLSGHVEAGMVLATDLGIVVPAGQVRMLVVRGEKDAAGTAGFMLRQQPARWPQLAEALKACRLHYSAGGVGYYILDADHDGGAPAARKSSAEERWDFVDDGPGLPTGPALEGMTGAGPGTQPGTRDGTVPGTQAGAGTAAMAAVVSQAMPMRRVGDESGKLADMVRGLADGQVVEDAGGGLDHRAQGWVEALGGYQRADLVATVRSYLRHRGQWEGAARELGLHRNSLRHRMGIAVELLQADPDDPDVAANLWLALRRL